LYTENNNFSIKRRNLVEQLSGFLAFDLSLIPYVVITLLVAFTVHEFAHAYVAYKFGDDTAKRQGRLTLNPIAHLDPFGTILIFLAGFGWARPVPVNRFHFKRPRLAGILVSVAGPLSNLLVAALALLIYIIFIRVGVFAAIPVAFGEGFETFFNLFVRLNIVLFIFNLLPFPPLDGYRIIEDLVPARIRPKLTQYEGLGIVLFLVLVITPVGDRFLYPLLTNGVYAITDMLVMIFRPILQL
jgi:Zn-dependent protease